MNEAKILGGGFVKNTRCGVFRFFAGTWLFVTLAITGGSALCQAAQESKDQATQTAEATLRSEVLSKLGEDTESIYYVEQAAHLKLTEAIPVLEKRFTLKQDPLVKAKVAEVLVRLGDENDIYWSFLVEIATPAIQSDAPNFMNPGDKPGLSPEFTAWAESHHLGPDAGVNAVYIYPGTVLLLGATGDRRAIPLLRQALRSPNYVIEAVASLGLAEVQDAGSIPLIIEACKKAPPEAVKAIARSLVYFDQPEAQAAVDRYLPKEEAQSLRQNKAQGEGALHK